jgi:hypothetical protein
MTLESGREPEREEESPPTEFRYLFAINFTFEPLSRSSLCPIDGLLNFNRVEYAENFRFTDCEEQLRHVIF